MTIVDKYLHEIKPLKYILYVMPDAIRRRYVVVVHTSNQIQNNTINPKFHHHRLYPAVSAQTISNHPRLQTDCAAVEYAQPSYAWTDDP